MSGAIRSRPDQIAELTRGIELPLPELSAFHLEIIAEGLLRAFSDVRLSTPTTVSSGSEAEVTALLESRLNTMVEEDPLWRQLVLCVARGKESLSFDGTHLEKRPDLSIYLSGQHRGFPLVVEAKIIDATTAKTEKMYCDNGVMRFVEGEYAWANREAYMIAYVRDGSLIDSKLTPFLSTAQANVPPGYLIEELPVASGSGDMDLARSRHGRNFTYHAPVSSSGSPGSISVWHLWLS
ncbi:MULTISPECIES: hypothetical protein [Alphaproteobacteria]|uniref:hypothetical protein n=1 Tax=Alphaproteobacteria TaxID=28211 RepID=UPI001B8A23E6|nr:hypothetical protein [Agrobacterium tumefaciens]WCK17107.1 hypothetical protein G6L41_025580 [Agrobacterium tumefaciens]WIE36464.1 hypothetical protein G6L82_026345 [Agrobacterium tumefaciens]|tara:strand:+ start:54503 stop:55213 length:711 start_codon:yes stop_codon:yes gene_type:complete